ncbi:hypothetical protein BP5796_12143 [Coleophoma crateriformis]|uniref:Zn(2)-C6 fungal-type domain-containing protein n=1 Tax=Coleophoma crateriformis TaxID=565419 RepID=A0A3D8QBR6_9HELO|nr:hypothetical protein BP5796_12143 [Coleophoma crateriformis]
MQAPRSARMLRRRVPPEKRQRTEMSCDFCKTRRCKCSRVNSTDPCRACLEHGKLCRTSVARKQRVYKGILNNSSNIKNLSSGQEGTQFELPTRQPIVYIQSPLAFPPMQHVGSASSTEKEMGRRSIPSDTLPQEYEWTAVRKRPRFTLAEYLFEDQMGLPQYIGPTGSYTCSIKIREIMAVGCASKSADFRFAVAQTMGPSMRLCESSNVSLDLLPRQVADNLVELFFSKVHCDFPVFHRALFQATYEGMWESLPNTEPAWLMTLYMVFILGLELCSDDSFYGISVAQKEAMKAIYLSKARALLPEVISGCTLGHVQALMLYCRHLHISRQRNTCWNIAGSAIRIAIAIGMHRNGTNLKCGPLERELRKRVWWTLYAFERIECSSLGRTSAINDEECNVGFPTEGLLDMGDVIPLGYVEAQSGLLMVLGTICKHQYNMSSEQGEFAMSISQELHRWYCNLPSHLMPDSNSPKSHCRAIILLHIQYHYTVTLVNRPILVTKAMKKHGDTSIYTSMAECTKSCIDSANSSVMLLQKLFDSGLFNSKTSWDVFFVESTAMILALWGFAQDQIAIADKSSVLIPLKTCINILKDCAEFSPTMQRFATTTMDFAQALISTETSRAGDEVQSNEFYEDIFRSMQTAPTYTTSEESCRSDFSEIVDQELVNPGGSFLDPFSEYCGHLDMSQSQIWDGTVNT